MMARIDTGTVAASRQSATELKSALVKPKTNGKLKN